MEERKYAYINSSMFDNHARTRQYRNSVNSETSFASLDSPNPLYQVAASRPNSKNLYSTIPELELQFPKHYIKSKPRKRSHKVQCLSRLISFLFMVIAMTALILVLLIILRKVGPDCYCTTVEPRQPALVPRGVIYTIQKELGDLKENIQMYKKKVNNLTREIQTMRHQSFSNIKNESQCVCPPGPEGPQGKQGKQGPAGPPGPPGYNGTTTKAGQSDSLALNTSWCQYKVKSSTAYSSDDATDTICSLREDEHKDFQITGITCSTKHAAEYFLKTGIDKQTNLTVYNCQCLGSSKRTNPFNKFSVTCYLNYWICRMAI